MNELNSHELLRRLANRDDEAAAAAFDRYVARLIALVRSRMSRQLARRIDPEDVVQSAYRSFFVHAANEEFVLSRAGDLWRLLAQIALNKLHGQIETHTARKRDFRREAANVAELQKDAETPEPTPGEIVALGELLSVFHAGLTLEERTMLTARLQGASAEAIAANLGKSPRTVRRMLAELQQRLELQLGEARTGPSKRRSPRLACSDPRASLAYGDFTLERLVGAGGMGKVYRAAQRSTGRTVALKALHKSRHDDPRAVEKFLQEAQILGQLDHQHIVHIAGVGQFPGGGYFIAMEYVDGVDLQTRLSRGPLPLAEAVRVVGDAAAAIGYAHDQGIVHGDLKPGNVLLDATGRVVVSDFGLAQFIGSRRREPRWLVGGTHGYTAPEIEQQGQAPTPAADIYGLGALLFALITGRPPAGETMATEFGAPVDRVLARCLSQDPQDRFGHAMDIAAELMRR